MKIILFGSGGTLGTQLQNVFANNAVHAPTSADIDITDRTAAQAYIKNIHPDLIINATAYNNVDGAESEAGKNAAFALNGEAVGNIADAAKACGAVFMHFSTDHVFDGLCKSGYTEHMKTNPKTAYGKSKLFGEKLVLARTKKYYIIRLSRLFGEKGSSDKSKKSFVDLMRDLARTRNELKVVHDKWGKPTYAPDIARATRSLIENNSPYGVYHITNEGVCTWYEFAQEIFKYTDMSPKLIPVSSMEFPRAADIPTYSILQNTKIPKLRSWQEALKEYGAVAKYGS